MNTVTLLKRLVDIIFKPKVCLNIFDPCTIDYKATSRPLVI